MTNTMRNHPATRFSEIGPDLCCGDPVCLRATREQLRELGARPPVRAVAAGAASTLELGAGRFEEREAGRLVAGVEVAELEPVGGR